MEVTAVKLFSSNKVHTGTRMKSMLFKIFFCAYILVLTTICNKIQSVVENRKVTRLHLYNSVKTIAYTENFPLCVQEENFMLNVQSFYISLITTVVFSF